MKNVTEQFNRQFLPFKALLLYKNLVPENDHTRYAGPERTEIYVESYDIGRHGQPINAHPLTIAEMIGLSDLLGSSREMTDYYLKSKGILPPNLLYLRQQANGFAVWFTPPQAVYLFFTESLGIPSGRVCVPAMVWKATKDSLYVYALKGKAKPTAATPLCHAPFFNIYGGGNVCMGTVNIQIDNGTGLDEFMQLWQQYFFGSNFSHSINGNSSTKSDTAGLWRFLVNTDKPFPPEQLVKNGRTLSTLFV